MDQLAVKPIEKPREYYTALDGFRGLLAVFVAMYHTIWLSHPNTWAFFDNGAVIIDLFFALSGFLMWRLYSERLDTPAAIKAFMKRRFARLYPLHLFMLMVFLSFAVVRIFAHKVGIADTTPGEVLPFETGATDGWFSLLQNLTLTHSFGLSDSLTFNPPSWTIGAEFYTYIIFAGMMLWCKPQGRIGFIFIGVGISLIYVVLSQLKSSMNITYDYGFWRCLAGFYTGLLAAVTFKCFRTYFRQLSASAFTLIEICVIFLSTAFVIYVGGRGQFLVGPVIFLFILTFANDGGAVSWFMSRRPFRYLAKISYSVYLTHVIISIGFAIIIKALLGDLPSGWVGDAWLVAYLCVVIGFSHLTQRFVEVPGGNLIRQWRSPQNRVAEDGASV